MTSDRSLKVGTSDKRKVRRSWLLQKRKAETESESVGLSDYRKMRFARSLYRTQLFCNSGRRWRTGSSLILETGLFIQNRTKNGSVPNSGIKIIYQRGFKNGVRI